MRRVLLVIAVAIAVAVGFSVSTLRATVARGAEEFARSFAEQEGADVEVGDVELSIFPLPTVAVTDIVVRPKGASKTKDGEPVSAILEVPSVTVHPHPMPLFVGATEIAKIEAVGATLRVEREKSAKSFSTSVSDEAVVRLASVNFPIHVVDARVVFADARPSLPIEAMIDDIDGVLSPNSSGGLAFDGTLRPFGEHSFADLSLSFTPNKGPTGGDALSVRGKLAGADGQRLKAVLPLLDRFPLAGPADAEFDGEGFLGERSTESVPAESFDVAFNGGVDLDFMGRTERLTYDAVLSMDDKRVQVKGGKYAWAGAEATGGGYIDRKNRKLSGKLTVAEIDIDATAEAFGVTERWRPKAKLAGVIRLTGKEREPLINYEGTSPGFTFDSFEGYEVEGGPSRPRGSLFASNAVWSMSLIPDKMRIGPIELKEPSVGGRFFRDKFTITAIDVAVWGGKSNSGISYKPEQDGAIEGGTMVELAEADLMLADLFPDMGLQIKGTTNVIAQLGIDTRGVWSMGRIGFYDGRMGPVGIGHAVLTAIADRSDIPRLRGDDLRTAYPSTLGAESAVFDEIKMDYQTRDDGLSLRSITIDLPHARIVAEGVIGNDDAVAGWGVMTLSETLSAELFVRVPALADLAAADGKLRIPVKGQGTVGGIAVDVDERFAFELNRAIRGEPVGPFVTTEPEPVLDMDLPTLDEQFAAW